MPFVLAWAKSDTAAFAPHRVHVTTAAELDVALKLLSEHASTPGWLTSTRRSWRAVNPCAGTASRSSGVILSGWPWPGWAMCRPMLGIGHYPNSRSPSSMTSAKPNPGIRGSRPIRPDKRCTSMSLLGSDRPACTTPCSFRHPASGRCCVPVPAHARQPPPAVRTTIPTPVDLALWPRLKAGARAEVELDDGLDCADQTAASSADGQPIQQVRPVGPEPRS
jgi:hypothetical protein